MPSASRFRLLVLKTFPLALEEKIERCPSSTTFFEVAPDPFTPSLVILPLSVFFLTPISKLELGFPLASTAMSGLKPILSIKLAAPVLTSLACLRLPRPPRPLAAPSFHAVRSDLARQFADPVPPARARPRAVATLLTRRLRRRPAANAQTRAVILHGPRHPNAVMPPPAATFVIVTRAAVAPPQVPRTGLLSPLHAVPLAALLPKPTTLPFRLDTRRVVARLLFLPLEKAGRA